MSFTVHYLPYQLYPEASKEGEDKYEWYKKSRYANSEEKMQMYKTLMTAYGMSAGINYSEPPSKFGSRNLVSKTPIPTHIILIDSY